jgi:hypothetical protein
VQSRLITEIGEEIVDCWALPSAPGNETHRGTFNNGALVLTNLRVLMPYTFSWEEVHGNVKTTYKGAGMPTLPLPALERIEVVSKKRVKRKLLITFQYKEGQISISPHRTNLSKLLLVAQLWGVPIEAREDDARLAELRWALWTPWLSGVIVLALLFLGAAVLGLFGDGMVDSMGDFSDFLRRWALLQWAAIGIAAFSGRRLMRWTFAYSAIDLAETLRNLPRSNDPRPGR